MQTSNAYKDCWPGLDHEGRRRVWNRARGALAIEQLGTWCAGMSGEEKTGLMPPVEGGKLMVVLEVAERVVYGGVIWVCWDEDCGWWVWFYIVFASVTEEGENIMNWLS